ncbi:hypothetical protein AB0I49_13525 [Streptomyces sp. NPDC050617]|uniref:hypothetical protein n=1 Tax=Streptomyces sp. NPDC050617 TaxID=3154628 RepID=UPI003422918A
MKTKSTFVPVATAVLLLGGGLTAATAGPAAASNAPDVSIQRACTADAPHFTSSPGTSAKDPAFWPARGTYATATSRCADINLKLDKTREVRACIKTLPCNKWRTLTKGKWGVAAYKVNDGAQFYLQFKGTAKATGQIDY